jgi:hypothetical protein
MASGEHYLDRVGVTGSLPAIAKSTNHY